MERNVVISRGIARWRQFWLTPQPPHALAILRIVMCGYVVKSMLPRDLDRLSAVVRRPAELREFSFVLEYWPIPFPQAAQLILDFHIVLIVLGLCAAVGLLTRPALVLFAAGYLYAGAAISAWGYIAHSRAVPAQVLAILAVAPGTTAWSVDRALAWLWNRRARTQSLAAHLAGTPVARWGLQLIVAVFAIVLFSAGVSKLRDSGVGWADGQTLGFYLNGGGTVVPASHRDGAADERWRHGFSPSIGPVNAPPDVAWKDGWGLDAYLYNTHATALGRAIGRHAWMLVALSVLTLVFELSAPIMLIGPAFRSLYLLAALAFFAGIKTTMGIDFRSWVVVGLCLVDWPWIIRAARSGLAHAVSTRFWRSAMSPSRAAATSQPSRAATEDPITQLQKARH